MVITRDEVVVAINVLLLVAAIVALARPKLPKFHVFDKDATTPLRFILAVFVAITHLPWLTPLKLGTPAVVVFFFISGCGMVKSYLAKGDKYLDGFTW